MVASLDLFDTHYTTSAISTKLRLLHIIYVTADNFIKDYIIMLMKFLMKFLNKFLFFYFIRLTNLGFVDDNVLFSSTATELEIGQKMNNFKTKVKTNSIECMIEINREVIAPLLGPISALYRHEKRKRSKGLIHETSDGGDLPLSLILMLIVCAYFQFS